MIKTPKPNPLTRCMNDAPVQDSMSNAMVEMENAILYSINRDKGRKKKNQFEGNSVTKIKSD